MRAFRAIAQRRAAAAWLAAVLLAAVAAPTAAQLPRNGRPARPSVTLPDGPVRAVILESCTACHGIDEYGYYAMSRASWDALIERMRTAKSGVVEGAVIDASGREILLDWLVAEFGPDATPFPREYVVRELTRDDLLTDVEAEALLARACEGCHAAAVTLKRAALDEAQWRTLLTGKIATGVPILIDEVDPLIEWLMRAPVTAGSN